MNEEMKELGELFRNKRQEKKLSIKDVENATSIRSVYLEAIEEARFERFLSKVYMVGFMRQYASFLDLDVETLIQEKVQPLEFPEARAEFDYGIGTLEVRGAATGGVKWIPSVLWAGAIGFVAVLAYYLMRYFKLV